MDALDRQQNGTQRVPTDQAWHGCSKSASLLAERPRFYQNGWFDRRRWESKLLL